MRNRCIDYQRTRKPEFEWPDEWEFAGGTESEKVLAEKELWQEFSLHFSKLSPDAKMALYLFAVEELPYYEIARIMGKNGIQIKTILYRARKKLKQERSGAT